MTISRLRHDDRGIALVFMALSLVALLTITALVIDIGNARQQARRAQNSLDAAALAAAAFWDGSSGPEKADGTSGGMASSRDRALELLDVNDFPNITGSGNTRSCGNGETCTFTFSFARYENGVLQTGPVPLTPPTPTVDTRLCVSVAIGNLRVPTFFAGVIGQRFLEISRTVNGCKRFSGSGGPSTALPAAHAFGDCSSDKEAFNTSGNNGKFIGDIQSNDGAVDSSVGTVRRATADPASPVSRARVGVSPPFDPVDLGSGSLWDPPMLEHGAADLPNPFSGIASTLFAPGGSRARQASDVSPALYRDHGNADVEFASGKTALTAGIHYTTGKMLVKSPDVIASASYIVNGVPTTFRGVTLVASEIKFEGDSARIPAFEREANRIALFASRDQNDCAAEGIALSGTCNHFNGVLYAPTSRIRLSGLGNGNFHNGATDPKCGGATGGTGTRQSKDFFGGFLAPSLIISGDNHLVVGGSGGPSTLVPQVFLAT